MRFRTRPHRKAVALLELIRRLHTKRPDGTCTCDPTGQTLWACCPTAIALRAL